MSEAQPIYRVANPDPTIKPFRCSGCKEIIGETNGTSLRIGRAAFPFPVTFSCLTCGSVVKWRPVGYTNGNGNGGYP